MLNFRKLKQDFSSAILKEGRALHDKNKIVSAKIIRLDPEVIRFSAKILGNFDNTYESEIEIDRFESQAVHTNCDCPSRFDCAHLAALIFHLEEKIDSLIVEYSKEADISKSEHFDTAQKKELLDTIKEAREQRGGQAGRPLSKAGAARICSLFGDPFELAFFLAKRRVRTGIGRTWRSLSILNLFRLTKKIELNFSSPCGCLTAQSRCRYLI